MKRKYLPGLLIIILSSCYPSQKSMNAKEDALFNKWLNYSKARLIKSWGQPDSTRSDGKRGEILIYKEAVDYKSVMDQKYTGKLFSFRKEMYINADSIIYNWKSWRRK